MFGAYLIRDLGHLRAPHSAFNHVLKKIAFSEREDRWTKAEEQILEENQHKSDNILMEKIPSKTLYQIKRKIKTLDFQKYQEANKPYTLGEDLQILKSWLDGQGNPKSLEEFYPTL